MKIHFIILYVVFTLAFIYRQIRKKRDENKSNFSKIIFGIMFIIMFLFIGMRDISIGTDTVTYVGLFWARDYTYSNFEFLPQLISRIVATICNKYFIYLCILSAISMIGIFKCAKEYEFDTEIFMFLYITSYCYLYSASATRFFCAFSIIMLSFKYMINKDTKRVLLFILLACCFHTSAIIFIPIYFMTKLKFNTKNITMLLIIMSTIAFFENFVNLDFLYEINIFSKYSYIMENRNEIGGISLFINVSIFIFATLYYKNIKYYIKEYEFFFKMHIIGMLIDLIGIAYRVVWFFKFPIWFLIPIILYNLKKTNKRDYFILYFLFILIYSIVYYHLIKVSLSSHNFLNYTFNYSLR